MERQLARLDTVEIETAWIARILKDFDSVWEALTPENRVRLVHAVVREVIVDEPHNNVEVLLADLGAGEGDGQAVPVAAEVG